jgi:hypothetical protein
LARLVGRPPGLLLTIAPEQPIALTQTLGCVTLVVMTANAPPGLYPDPDPRRYGQLRYWNGQRWTLPYWTPWRIALTTLLPVLMSLGFMAFYVCVAGDHAEPPTPTERRAEARVESICALVVFPGEAALALGLALTHARAFRRRT